MATLSYDKQTVGQTSIMFDMPIGSGGISVGQLVASDGTAVTSGDSSIEALAMEDGSSGDDVLVMPVISGVSILQGTVDSSGSVSHGDAVGINNSFEIDADASNSLFIALEDGGSGDSVRLLVTAGL